MIDPYQQQGIERTAGSDDLEHFMHQQLETEQLVFFRNANRPRFEGFGGIQGFKDAARFGVFLLALGLFVKYVLGWG